jgi:hypothetical protein
LAFLLFIAFHLKQKVFVIIEFDVEKITVVILT